MIGYLSLILEKIHKVRSIFMSNNVVVLGRTPFAGNKDVITLILLITLIASLNLVKPFQQ